MDSSENPSGLVFPSNNDFSETMPFDSRDSNRLMGRIIRREIRPVPVCCIVSSCGTADPSDDDEHQIPTIEQEAQQQRGGPMRVRSQNFQAKWVAAYFRVSTLKENQEESFETQQCYYTDLINHTAGWQPVKVYADEGFSGVLAEKRPGCMAMMADARGNLIDIILVKSISRFARNAKEAQRYVHELKGLGVEVRFECEGISSMDGSAEMAFSMLAVAAQEESRSISENMKWSLRKHAEQGIRHLGSNRILGYNETDCVLVPNQDAWIVRVIFEDYAAGLYPIEIQRHLEDLGAVNSSTKRIPGSGNMRKVLSNEVSVGDRMIQTGPVRDLITKSARPASTGTRNRITCMGWYTAVNVDYHSGKVTAPSTRVPSMIIWCVAVESAGTGSSAPAQTGRSGRSASISFDQLRSASISF
jgi:DNA invertase Pin-like site-specific DNA recombinase